MSKGLEALSYFKTLFDIWKEKISVDDVTKEIEEEHEFKPRYELIEKELKALEILKEHIDGCVKFRVLKEPSDCFLVIEEWFLGLKTYEIKVAITQEEFDLLKEWLEQ